MTTTAPVVAGFADPVHDAQSTFRLVLEAMAHPGRIVSLPASPSAPGLGAAATAIALTLCDFDTPIWLDAAARDAAPYLSFHCGAPVLEHPGLARFAFVADPALLPPLADFALGTDEYPDRSAMLVIEAAGLAAGFGMRLTGPGIRGETRLGLAGLPMRFWAERATLAELFPRGLDVLFTDSNRLAALPRSTRVET